MLTVSVFGCTVTPSTLVIIVPGAPGIVIVAVATVATVATIATIPRSSSTTRKPVARPRPIAPVIITIIITAIIAVAVVVSVSA